jgi:Tol biopolymer transport system component
MSTRLDVNDDFGWTAPVNLGSAINTAANEITAAYFEYPANDGPPILYFASDRSGNFDIYQSKRNANGKFNTATNVTGLNSSGRDDGPSISRNGLEMLFSTNRDGGLPDIWVATRASVGIPWSPPVAVTSVNSEYEEAHPALSPDGTVIYFSSSRDGGSGANDIYTAHRLCTGSK